MPMSSTSKASSKEARIKVVEWTSGKHVGYVWAFIPQCYSVASQPDQALTIEVPDEVKGTMRLKLKVLSSSVLG